MFFPPKHSEHFWRIDCSSSSSSSSSANLSGNDMKKNQSDSCKSKMPKMQKITKITKMTTKSPSLSKFTHFQLNSLTEQQPSRKKTKQSLAKSHKTSLAKTRTRRHIPISNLSSPFLLSFHYPPSSPYYSLKADFFSRRKKKKRSLSNSNQVSKVADDSLTTLEDDESKKTKRIRRKILRNVVERLQTLINHEEFDKMFSGLDYSIFQGLTFDESFRGSFTVDKTNVNLCLKNPVSGLIYDINSITFVALHELAHVINPLYGHGKEFQQIFKNVLKVSDKIGIWDRNIPFTKQYCGTCRNGECFQNTIPRKKSRFMFVVKN